MAKLTLNVDKAMIAKAKAIARRRGISVSAMFSQFVEMLDSPRRKRRRTAPITRRSRGLVKLPADKTDRELIEDALVERYGR